MSDLIIKDKEGNYYKDSEGVRTPIDKPVIISRIKDGQREQLAPEPDKKRKKKSSSSVNVAQQPKADSPKNSPSQKPTNEPLRLPSANRLIIHSAIESAKVPSRYEETTTDFSPNRYQETIDKQSEHPYSFVVPRPKGVLTLADEPSATDKLLYNLETKGQKTNNQGLALGVGVGLVAYGIGEYGVGVIKDFSAVDFNTLKPRIPLTSTFKTITNPVTTVKDFAKFSAINPERAGGQALGMVALARIGGKVTKATPEYAVTRATGDIKVLETPIKTQILVEAQTKSYKGVGEPPAPRPFYAEVEGIATQQNPSLQVKAKVKDVVKINPTKGTVDILGRSASDIRTSIGQPVEIPDTTLPLKGRVIENQINVKAYERAIIKESPVDIYEYPEAGEGLFKIKTEQGLKIYQEPISAYTRRQLLKVEDTQIIGKGKEGIFTYREGTTINKPNIPKQTIKPTNKPLTDIKSQIKNTKFQKAGQRQVIIMGEYPELGELVSIRVKTKPIIKVEQKPITVTQKLGNQISKGIGIKLNTDGSSTQEIQPSTQTPTNSIISETKTETSARLKQIPPPSRPIPTATAIISPVSEMEPKIKDPIIKSKPKSRSRTNPIQILDPTTIESIGQDSIIDTSQDIGDATTPIIDITPIQSSETQRSNYARIREETSQRRRRLKLPNISNNEYSHSTGFSVFVRRGGIFKRERGVFNKADAIGFGSNVVANSPSATFKIMKTSSSPNRFFSGRNKINDFFKKGDLFIEKNNKRIDSVGELRGITFKSWFGKRRSKR